jgi:hypothetical protein
MEMTEAMTEVASEAMTEVASEAMTEVCLTVKLRSDPPHDKHPGDGGFGGGGGDGGLCDHCIVKLCSWLIACSQEGVSAAVAWELVSRYAIDRFGLYYRTQ